jgi:hypothetical protein
MGTRQTELDLQNLLGPTISSEPQSLYAWYENSQHFALDFNKLFRTLSSAVPQISMHRMMLQ